MRIKIILLTLVSGVTALVLAQNSPSASAGKVPGSPPVGSQQISPQNTVTNPTNGLAGITNSNPSMTNGWKK